MTHESRNSPQPRKAIADPALTRPSRYHGHVRPASILKLDWNENTDPTLVNLFGEILADLPPDIVATYPNLPPLYEKLANHLGISPDRIALAAGSEGAIRQIFEAFVDPGDVVALTEPTFGMYAVYAQMFGAEVVQIAYRVGVDGPALDVEEVLSIVSARRPKLFCLPNPDSPTGTVFAPADLRSIVEACADAGTLISIDEAYFPFYGETALPWIDEFDNLIVLRSTSKSWALAGLRIGWAMANPGIVEMIQKVRPMFEINSIATEIFFRALDHTDEMERAVARLNAGKAYFRGQMDKLGFRTFDCEGNFQHIAFGDAADRIHAALDGIVLYRTDTDMPCLVGYSRFSATTVEKFEPIVAAIRAVVDGKPQDSLPEAQHG